MRFETIHYRSDQIVSEDGKGEDMSNEAAMKARGTTRSGVNIRKMTMMGMLSAISYILMFLQFSVPLMPEFVKMDLSEIPVLIGAFSMGPVAGVVICLIKNILHLMNSSSGGIGELSNFLLGASFAITAGFIYKKFNTRKGAVAGAAIGALVMAGFSVVSNYYLVYPVYTAFMPMETIIAAYQVINPRIENLIQALLIFNLPFTFIKATLSALITFLVYKRISPVIKGNQ